MIHARHDNPSHGWPPASTSSAGEARRPGFTLMELIFAMAVFAVGLTVAASFFPTATYLQRRAFETTVSRQVGQSGAAMLRADPLAAVSGNIQAVDLGDWTIADRSYPQEGERAETDRQFYWLPLAGTVNGEKRVYVFVCVRDNDVENYAALTGDADAVANPTSDDDAIPRVARFDVGSPSYDETEGRSTMSFSDAGDFVSPGDPLLGSNGKIMTVAKVSGSNVTVIGDASGVLYVWMGLTHAKGRRGPGRHVEMVGAEAMQ